MGLVWIAGFACFVGSFAEPFLSFVFNFIIILIPFLTASFARHYRDRVLDGTLSFRRAYGYSLFIFFYATLLLAIAQWAYLEFLDNGRLLGNMTRTVNSPEFAPVLEAYQMTKDEVLAQLTIFSETRPIDFAFTFMWMNILLGLVLSFVIALFTKRTTARGNLPQRK